MLNSSDQNWCRTTRYPAPQLLVNDDSGHLTHQALIPP